MAQKSYGGIVFSMLSHMLIIMSGTTGHTL
ncbi:protein of unknown function [Paraburkholderia kururiensis]